MKESISSQDVCELLNEFLKLDSECANKLFSYREKCNEKIIGHPTIQVGQNDKVGFIGLLNGMFGVREDGRGSVCIEIDENEKILGFKQTPE